MDLFNKKKVAALQDELQMATAQLDAVKKDYESLQEEVLSMYNELTEYFIPKYKGKYLKYGVIDVEGAEPREERVKCLDVKFDGGLIEFTFERVSKDVYTEYCAPSDLRVLNIITKKEFKGVQG